MSFDVSRRTRAALILLVCAGCQPEVAIKTYTVERTSAPRPPVDAAEILESLDHILVAIVPQGDNAWFFKLVGKAPAIERQRTAFIDFLATVRLAAASADPPAWTLPDGWSQREASAMRAATLVVPDEGGDLELAVSSLPLTEDLDQFLVPNVNRWMRQLQQPSLSKPAIIKLKRDVPTESVDAAVFHLSGVMSDQTMGRPPGMGASPPAKPNVAASQEPQQSRPSASKPSAASQLAYETPEGWLPGKMSSMRSAAFFLPGGSEQGEVTVTNFPASPGTQMADVTANVQRWAGQVGMSEISDEKLAELTEPISISGIDGTYAELVSPAGADRSVAIFVAMINRDGQVWFFKMVGQSDAVRAERDAFRQFLSSVELP